jgi:hypothetical protein
MAYQVNLGLQALENSFAYGNNQGQAGMQPLIQKPANWYRTPRPSTATR